MLVRTTHNHKSLSGLLVLVILFLLKIHKPVFFFLDKVSADKQEFIRNVKLELWVEPLEQNKHAPPHFPSSMCLSLNSDEETKHIWI